MVVGSMVVASMAGDFTAVDSITASAESGSDWAWAWDWQLHRWRTATATAIHSYAYYDGGCYLAPRRVWTPWGWRFRSVEVCD